MRVSDTYNYMHKYCITDVETAVYSSMFTSYGKSILLSITHTHRPTTRKYDYQIINCRVEDGHEADAARGADRRLTTYIIIPTL